MDNPKDEEEKQIRIKYQDIVYKICTLFDEDVFRDDGSHSLTRCTIDEVVEKVKMLKRDPKDVQGLVPLNSKEVEHAIYCLKVSNIVKNRPLRK